MRRGSDNLREDESDFLQPQRRNAVTNVKMIWKDLPLKTLFERADHHTVAQFLQAFTEHHAKKTLHRSLPFPGVTQQVPLCKPGSSSFPLLTISSIELYVLKLLSDRDDVTLRDMVVLGEVCPAMYCNIKELLQNGVELLCEGPSEAVVADRETVSWLREARLQYRSSDDNPDLARSLPSAEDVQDEKEMADKHYCVSVKLV